MNIGRKNFVNDHSHDQDLDVAPEWQIGIGKKSFEEAEQSSAPEAIDLAAAEEVAEVPDAAAAELENENDQGKEATDDCPQEVD